MQKTMQINLHLFQIYLKIEIEVLVIIHPVIKNYLPWQQQLKVCIKTPTEIKILLKDFLVVLSLHKKMNRLSQKFNMMIMLLLLILNSQVKKMLLKINYRAIVKILCQNNSKLKKAEFSKEEFLIPNPKFWLTNLLILEKTNLIQLKIGINKKK
jgi:hypothetical protein